MTRAHYRDSIELVLAGFQKAVPGASVYVYQAGSTTPVSPLYSDASTSATYSQPLTTDQNGVLDFYLASSQSVKFAVSGGGITSTTLDNIPVLSPDQVAVSTTLAGDVTGPAGSNAIGAGAVTTSKLGDGAATGSKLGTDVATVTRVLKPTGASDTAQLALSSAGDYWLVGGTFNGVMRITGSNVNVFFLNGAKIKPAAAANTVAVGIGTVNAGTIITDVHLFGAIDIDGNGSNQTMSSLALGADSWGQKYGAQGMVLENVYRFSATGFTYVHDTWNSGITVHGSGSVSFSQGEAYNTGIQAGTLPCNAVSIEASSSLEASYPAAGINFSDFVVRKYTSVGWDIHGTGTRQVSLVNCHHREPVAAAEGISIEIESSDSADNRLVSIIGGSGDGTNISQGGTGVFLQVTTNNSYTHKLITIVGHTLTNYAVAYSVQGQGISVAESPMNNVAVGVSFSNNNQTLVSRDISFANSPITLASSGLPTGFGQAVGLYLNVQANVTYDAINFANIEIRAAQVVTAGPHGVTYAGVYTSIGASAHLTNLTLNNVGVNGFNRGFYIRHTDPCVLINPTAHNAADGTSGITFDTGAQATVWGGDLRNNNGAASVGENQAGICLKGPILGLSPKMSDGAPAVPASGTAIQNTTGYDCNVCIAGGTVTDVQVGSTSTTASTGLGASPVSITLPANQYIKLTYSAAPTWKWVRL